MLPEIEPTAEGDLRSTPISHLLVYALDHRLTGALFLTEASGVTHTVRLARGVPVKIRPGDDHARLGELLLEAGILTEDLLAGALAAKGLLGDVLILAGKIQPERLDELLEEQFRTRVVRLFALGPDTKYRYYDGHCELVDWGGDPAAIDPLELMWAGLKRHASCSTKLAEVIGKLGDAPLALHPSAVVDRFVLDEAERAVADLLAEKPSSLAELAEWELLAQSELETFVYALIITRQIDVGTNALPVGADLRHNVTTPPAGNQLGRVRLRSAQHRLGAAAPDPPGDGERAPVAAPSRRRRSAASSSDLEPISEVAPALDPRPPASGVSERAAQAPLTQPSPRMHSGEAPMDEAAAAAPIETAQAAADPEAAPVAVAPAPVSRRTSISALVLAATDDLRERDAAAALSKCTAALALDPEHHDAITLAAQARSMLPGADLKALVLELDDLLRRDERHVQARFVRAQLRRRLSDDAGALRDLDRVLEAMPDHTDAARERAGLVARQPREKEGLLSRLLRR